MRREVIGAAMAFCIVASGNALAGRGETTDLHVPPERQADIREWVVKNPPKAYRFTETVVVGTTLPAEVELAPVPEAWGTELRTYHYVYGDGRVVLVEPASRRVVYVVE
jgi:hypothetical protein